MYITKVEIHNFQSHVHTVADLYNDINVLVGTSDSGKSSFMRALKWNLMNSPSGSEFIRVGENEASVSVTWSDGHKVERKRNRTGSKNSYALLKDGVILEEYTGFGGSVPQKILEVTGINLDLTFNFANQLESAFLLSDSPKVRAETIGHLEELGRIDQELVGVNDDIRLNKKEQKAKQKELSVLESEYQQLKNGITQNQLRVDTVRMLKNSIEQKQLLYNQVNKSAERVRVIRELTSEIEEVIRKSGYIVSTWNEDMPNIVTNAQKIMQYMKRLESIQTELSTISYLESATLDNLQDLSNKATDISRNHERILHLQLQLNRVTKDIKENKGRINPKTAALDIRPIDLEVERYMALFKHRNTLTNIKKTSADTKNEIQGIGLSLERLLNEFVDALHNEEICPTCTQPTEQITFERIEQTI